MGGAFVKSPATVSGPVVTRVSGPIVQARGMEAARMYEVVHVGEGGLAGEVVKLDAGRATIQVYEDTTLLAPGAPCNLACRPVLLGPGLIGNIYDGIQRPLPALRPERRVDRRGEKVPARYVAALTFRTEAGGRRVTGGTIIGTVAETPVVSTAS